MKCSATIVVSRRCSKKIDRSNEEGRLKMAYQFKLPDIGEGIAEERNR